MDQRVIIMIRGGSSPARFLRLICAEHRSSRQRTSRDVPLRYLSSSSSSTNGKDGTGGGTVWERQAVSIKNTDLNSNYLEAMRAEHDPSLHIKTIEDELKGSIGKALGRQGDKILRAVQRMHQEHQIYHDAVQQQQCVRTRQRAAKNYNRHRQEALQARWELTVHRQAAGFIVNNHNYVQQQYPIAPKLPEAAEEINGGGGDATKEQKDDADAEKQPKKKKQFTDQLDWWQRIGRWR